MKKPDASIILLAIAAFLAPIMGGYGDFTSQAAPSGLGNIVTGLFSWSACVLAHCLLGILIVVALAIPLFKKQVLQLPHPRIGVVLGLFVLLLALTIIVSDYRMLSLTTFAEWTLYAVAFVTAAGCVGRTNGPRILLGAFVAGCTVVALGGLKEYVLQADPTWRIMYLWQDPNALAGMLVLGIFAAIGLGMTSKLSGALLNLLGAGFMGSALLLTQSKGGLIAAAAGFLAFFLMIGFYSRAKAASRLGFLLAPLVLVLAFTPLLQKMQRSAPPTSAPPVLAPSPNGTTTAAITGGLQRTIIVQTSAPAGEAPNSLSRLLNPAATAEQSAAFRFNLWKGCLDLIKTNPAGYGMGTYRFQSTRPGNTTETKLAHDSYLQLAVEAGPLSAILLVVFLLLCAFEMLRSSRKLPEAQNLLRAGIFAAVLASTVHNFIDSDLYFFGSGVSYFLLLGIGIALSSDALMPELLSSASKAVALAAGVFSSVFLLYAGDLQLKIESFLAGLAIHSPDAPAEADALRSFCPMDYRVWYYSVPVATNLGEAFEFAHNAVMEGPTEAGYHRLAIVALRSQHPKDAISDLQKALKMDPNSLEALSLLLRIEKDTDPVKASEIARRMVDIEKTPYFSTRALPDVVPTETYEARDYLSQQTKDIPTQISLLRPAVEGFSEYATKTVPEIVRMASVGATSMGSPTEAVNKVTEGLTAARRLETMYHASNDPSGEAWAKQAQGIFVATLSELDKAAPSSK